VKLTTVADGEAVAARGACIVARAISEALAARGTCQVALAGGSIMEAFHQQLSAEAIDWGATHLWLSDERAVAPNDDDSNFKMVVRTLLDHIDIPAGNVHRPLGELGADDAAADYEFTIRSAVPDSQLDVVMCGMGPDGHTCSLFPGRLELQETDRIVVPVHDAPKPPPDRITFTLPLIHRARHTLLLTSGASKSDAMAAVVAGPDPHVPASLLRFGSFEVIADDAAAPARVRR